MNNITIPVSDVDICMIVYNEQYFIEECLKRLHGLFPDIYILDMESTDRTLSIVRDIYGDRAHITSQPRAELFRSGFAKARNRVTATAERTWVFHVDADELLVPLDGDSIIINDPNSTTTVKVTRRNLKGGAPVLYDNELLAKFDTSSVEQHVRLYKRLPEAHWESFLHEELWIGDGSAHENAGTSNIVLDHVSAFRPAEDRAEKERFYAWILLKMYRDPSLQFGAREFYLKEYIPKNLERFEEMAKAFSAKNDL